MLKHLITQRNGEQQFELILFNLTLTNLTKSEEMTHHSTKWHGGRTKRFRL